MPNAASSPFAGPPGKGDWVVPPRYVEYTRAVPVALSLVTKASDEPPRVPLSTTQGVVQPAVKLVDCVTHVTYRSEEHTSELQSRLHLVCRLLLEKKNVKQRRTKTIVGFLALISASVGHMSVE